MTTLSQPLAGCVMVITADRRKHELASALERRGATIQRAAALSTVPHLDDEQLVADTRAVITHPPHVVAVTTGIGFRSWLEAADAAGLSDDLLACLRGARLVARGPKARGAIQAAGLECDWVAQSETAAELRDHVLAAGVEGLRITVQNHGNGSDGLDDAFERAGAQVQSLLVYGWGPPAEPDVHREWVHKVATGGADAVIFTSAPGAEAWMATARDLGVLDSVVRRSADGSLFVATVGPVTAQPLEEAGVVASYPDRWRLGALIREVVRHYEEDSANVATAGGTLALRATVAVLDERVLPLTPPVLAVLRALADAGGKPLTHDELAHLLAASSGPDEVDAAIGHLREAAGEGIVRTVAGSGYALQVAS